jgi:hypothetical protein
LKISLAFATKAIFRGSLKKLKQKEPVSFSIDTPLAFIVTVIAAEDLRNSQAASQKQHRIAPEKDFTHYILRLQ